MAAGGLTRKWNGLPMYAWLGIGGAATAGLFVFVRGLHKAPAATTSTTIAVTPSDTGMTNPAPPPAIGPIATPPLERGSSSAPAPMPAGVPGHVYSAQDVKDLFARVGLTSPSQIAGSTYTQSGETAQQRIDRIVRDLNSGTRSLDQVTTSISQLPGAAGSTNPPRPWLASTAPTMSSLSKMGLAA